jgi:uncharacterized membrane protein
MAATGNLEPAAAGEPAPLLFEARLTPHRSLPPAAFLVILAAVAAVGFAAGMVSIRLGAWPVTGFCGLEFVLFGLMFRLNYRSAGRCDWVRLHPDRLEVVREVAGRETGRWSVPPYWLKVILEHEDGSGRLWLRSHGSSLAVGTFLGPGERIRFKDALDRALAGLRGPQFDQGPPSPPGRPAA